jgi:hypothetical protein
VFLQTPSTPRLIEFLRPAHQKFDAQHGFPVAWPAAQDRRAPLRQASAANLVKAREFPWEFFASFVVAA